MQHFNPAAFKPGGSWLGREVVSLDECDSTNDRAAALVEQGARQGLVVVAGHQQAGRGRWGRRWESKPGLSLLFTAVLPSPHGEVHASQVAIALAVAAARQLESMGLDVKLKWPNDVVVDGRKLAGMLLEVKKECLLVGMGLNLRQRREDFPADLEASSTSLLMLGHSIPAETLLAGLLGTMEEELETLQKKGFQPIKEAWHQRACYLGDPVRIKTAAEDGEPREGIVMGLDSDGALLLRSDHGLVLPVVAGDLIQLRPLPQSS